MRATQKIESIIATLLLASATTLANASDVVCADSAADVADALSAHSDGGALAGNTLDLRLKANKLYAVGAQTGNLPFTYRSTAMSLSLEISGNWDDTCTNQSATFPTSILDGSAKTAVTRLDSDYGGIYVDRIVVQNGKTTEAGAGLTINSIAAYGGIVRVEHSVIRNNTTTGFYGGILAYTSAERQSGNYEYVSTNIIVGNHADLDFGGGRIEGINLSNGSNPSVYCNVAYGNTSNNDGGLSVGGTGDTTNRPNLVGNVFRGNTGSGLDLFGNGAFMQENAYGTLSGTAPFSEYGTINGAPKFVDADNADFHLASGSPLVGAIDYQLLGYCSDVDMDGRPRTKHSPGDMGVYAETIFASGLEH